MTTAANPLELKQTPVLTRLGMVVLNRCWAAFLQWRGRAKIRAELYRLSDAELQDFGISRGEIEHIASRRTVDPSDICLPR
jgi:uncharacterized protein YjiS (DUF1127 family)